MEKAIEEIKKKADIVSFLSSFVSLKKTGRNFKALCPFHQERTPSFVISPDRQIWHCFGACQEGGDIIKFLMKWENITFIEALKELADKFDVQLTGITHEDTAWKKKEIIIRINQKAAEFYEYILHKTKFGKRALNYLLERKLDFLVAKKFQLGYAPNSWSSLLNFLLKKFNRKDILDTGLIIKSDRGTFYDRFRERIIFPIKDARGNIIGFSGRTLAKNPKEAKYINTPETLLYHKRESLYGLDVAKESIKKKNNVLLVEGELDVLLPYQYGFENVLAIKGSAITKEQLMLLKRYTNQITLALDSDIAGEEAMRKGVEEAEDLEFDVGVATFDYAKDPDEAVRKDSTKFKKIINNPIPFYDFIIRLAFKKYPDNNPYHKKKIAEEIATCISKIKNPIVLSYYIKKLSSILNVSDSSVEALLRNIKYKKNKKIWVQRRRINHPSSDLSRETVIQKYLLSVIFQNENPYILHKKIFTSFSKEDLSLRSYKKIMNYFENYKIDHELFNLQKFIQFLPQELHPVFDEMYLFASSDIEIKKEKIEKLMYELKRIVLKKRITQLLSNEDADNKEKKDELRSTNQELSQVEKMIIAL